MIKLFWWKGDNDVRGNFGDELSPYLVEKLSGQKVIYCDKPKKNDTVFLAVGSIFQFCTIYHSVWGAGVIKDDVKFNKPKTIYAVRGPLTREVLIRQGIKCPQIYGDPTLLLPMIYKPSVIKRYKLGIIPHYIDKDNNYFNYHKSSDVLVINVLDPVEKVIDDINSCECIVSSSLHGLIAADAYGIPSLWVQFSDKIIGQGFKFKDYLMSVGVKPYMPFQITSPEMTIQEIINNIKYYKINIDLQKLLDVCPFWVPNKIQDLIRRLKI